MPTVIEDWGYWRIAIDGSDVTSWRETAGISGPVHGRARYNLQEPFGCGPATIEVPMLRPLDTPGSGATSWWRAGAPVDIIRLHPDASTTVVWRGVIADDYNISLDASSGRVTIPCLGDMEAAGLQMHQPPAALEPTDIGVLVPEALNAVVGRRYNTIAAVTTGILSTKRGSDDQSVLAYAQELLADATTNDGTNQWTITRSSAGVYAMALKNTTTQHRTITIGQRGVEPRLSRDATKAPTHIFMSGVDKNGFAWSNMHYPGATSDDAPPYPFGSSSSVMTIGATDAATASGDGVSRLQRRINELNVTANVAVDGIYNAADAAAVRIIQQHYGLQVDGVTGPQTWAATFDVGGGANIGGMVRLPLAYVSAAQPTLWAADGSTAGVNPGWEPGTLRVDLDINAGSGVSKEQGRRAARALLARDYPAGIVGDVTLRGDPPEASRFASMAGQNWRVNGAPGDPLLHCAGVQVDTDGPVTIALDQRSRDLLTLIEVRQRNREMSVNTVRQPKNRYVRRSTATRDAVVAFDGESRGGIVPEFALYSGLWSVIRIPVAQSGRIAKTRITTKSPATPFAFAIFGAPITPAGLLGIVGNPLASDDPWEPRETQLDDYGWVEAWGSQAAPCGRTRAGTLTGRFRDDGTLEFRSLYPPILWLAFYSPTACRVGGRLYPAPLEA